MHSGEDNIIPWKVLPRIPSSQTAVRNDPLIPSQSASHPIYDSQHSPYQIHAASSLIPSAQQPQLYHAQMKARPLDPPMHRLDLAAVIDPTSQVNYAYNKDPLQYSPHPQTQVPSFQVPFPVQPHIRQQQQQQYPNQQQYSSQQQYPNQQQFMNQQQYPSQQQYQHQQQYANPQLMSQYVRGPTPDGVQLPPIPQASGFSYAAQQDVMSYGSQGSQGSQQRQGPQLPASSYHGASTLTPEIRRPSVGSSMGSQKSASVMGSHRHSQYSNSSAMSQSSRVSHNSSSVGSMGPRMKHGGYASSVGSDTDQASSISSYAHSASSSLPQIYPKNRSGVPQERDSKTDRLSKDERSSKGLSKYPMSNASKSREGTIREEIEDEVQSTSSLHADVALPHLEHSHMDFEHSSTRRKASSKSLDCPFDGCGKTFGRQDHLKKHILTHTGEKPFPCPQCGKRFSRMDKLKCHQQIHAEEQPITCPQCGEVFSRRRALRDHIASMHNEASAEGYA